MLPSATSLAKGKKMVLMNTLNTAELGKSLIACVDSDYDFCCKELLLLHVKLIVIDIFFRPMLMLLKTIIVMPIASHEVCVQATLNDRHLIDFNEFMKRYSQIAYPLFLWSVWFYRRHDTYTFTMSEFNACVRLHDVSLRHPERSLEAVRRSVTSKLSELSTRFPQGIEEVDKLSVELKGLGVLPDTTYLFIQGHHIMDNVVMKVLTPVCTALRREREQEIKNWRNMTNNFIMN